MSRAILSRRSFPVRATPVWTGLGIFSVVVLVSVAGVYWALRRAPAFYCQALERDVQRAAEASQEMGSRASALLNAVRKEGPWQALFTAEQINGYLAVDLPRNHGHLLSAEFHDPRVAIAGDRFLVGFQWQGGWVAAVGSVELSAYLVEPNVVAFRIHAVRAGHLPMPLDRLLKAIRQSAARMDIPLRWAQAGGDPVAVITLPVRGEADGQQAWLETLELRDGQVHLAGHSRRVRELPSAVSNGSDQSDVAVRDATKANRQRR